MPEQQSAKTPVHDSYLAGQRVVAVLNNQAGSLAGDSDAANLDRLHGLFRAAGIDAEVQLAEPDRFESLLANACASDAQVIIIGGGDGSVNTAVKHLHRTGKTLGVLPMGTLNHFAQSLGMPNSLEDAVRALSLATPGTVDIGEVNGKIFVNNASVGIYPEAVRMRERYREKLGMRKYVAMSYALAALMRELPVLRLRLEKEGERQVIKTPFLFLGNNRYEPKFLSYARRESLTEGCLSVFYAHNVGAFALMRIALNVLMGRTRQDPELECIEAAEITIASRMRRLRVAMDGEVFRMRPPLRFRILPESLNVLFARNEA